jgi:hypothetical protein
MPKLPSRPPRSPTPYEIEVQQILAEGRAERARQALERRQRDAEEFARLEAGTEVQRLGQPTGIDVK